MKGQHLNEPAFLIIALLLYVAGIGIFLFPIKVLQHASVPQHARLEFNLSDNSISQPDPSVANAEVIAASQAHATPTGEKVGTNQVKLVITNGYAHRINVIDVQLIDIKTSPPIDGTLFASIAQGEAPNDLLGVDFSNRRPVLRQMTSTGQLADPFFVDSHIFIRPHDSEVLVITILAGAPRSYAWKFRVDYDAGYGQRFAVVKASPNLLRLSGYVHTYKRVYEQEGSVWQQRSGTNFCPATGAKC